MTDQASGSPQTVDYAALVKGARAGDKAAFTALYEATHKEIFRTIRAMVRTEDQALDIQQDAYVQAFTHLEQLTAPERFRPWMRSIAVNQTRLALRKQTPVLFSELSAEDEEEASQLAEIADLRPEASPELHMERKEYAAYVQEILDELTPGQRMLVGMYYYDQRPMREIADELSINLGTVKSQLSRTRKKIEAAVRQLEKKGVKLYGLSPLPFLFAMIQRLSPAESTEKAVLDGALSQSGAAAETVALQLGRPFFETVAGKVVLGVLAAGVLCGGIFGYRLLRSSHDYGDVRPPAGVETAEDLSTEPTQITEPLWAVTPEDLPTEPETEEAVASAEPETTEALPMQGDSGQDIAELMPAAPASPSVPSSSEGEEPASAETQATGSVEISVSCAWEDGSTDPWFTELSNGAKSESRNLIVSVTGSSAAIPELYTDQPDLVTLTYNGSGFHREGDTDQYCWVIVPMRNGTSHIFCRLNGIVTELTHVTVPDYPDQVIRVWDTVSDSGRYTDVTLDSCFVGSIFNLSADVHGASSPVFTTDNPSVVELGYLYRYSPTWPGLWTPTYNFSIEAKIIGTGDAHIYMTFLGKTEKVWEVHASVGPNTDASAEDISP